MTEQLAVRIPDSLARALDELVAKGEFPSKAHVIRTAIEMFIDLERRRRIGEDIVAGYTRVPQTDEEVAAATKAAIHSIEEEPW